MAYPSPLLAGEGRNCQTSAAGPTCVCSAQPLSFSVRSRLVTAAGLGTGQAELKEELVGTSFSQKATSLPLLAIRVTHPLNPQAAKSSAPPDIVFSHLLPYHAVAHGQNHDATILRRAMYYLHWGGPTRAFSNTIVAYVAA